jgi:hypothetical protein
VWLERLTANAEVATVLCSIPASSDTSGAADEAVLNTVHKKKSKNPPVKSYCFLDLFSGLVSSFPPNLL